MKVEGPNRAGPAGQTKKKDKTAGTGGFGDLLTGGTRNTAAAGATHSIAMLDALLSVQGAEDPTERAARKRMRQRADDILGQLDKIRLCLLTGTLTVGHVIDVADVVASHREKVMDPRLLAVLDEVDLRAQIEIAKMTMALQDRGHK